jgi:hypothetical protein
LLSGGREAIAIRKQETEFPETLGGPVCAKTFGFTPGRKSVVNMQAFPRDFLRKIKPEFEQGASAAIASSKNKSASINGDAGFSTVSTRSAGEPRIVEVFVRARLNA